MVFNGSYLYYKCSSHCERTAGHSPDRGFFIKDDTAIVLPMVKIPAGSFIRGVDCVEAYESEETPRVKRWLDEGGSSFPESRKRITAIDLEDGGL